MPTASATKRAQPAPLPSATPRSHLDLAELETWLENKADANLFSGAVLIARDGVPIFERAYGMANKSFKAPNRIDTKFNLASMGKMFTAVAIAQLAEQGRLSFDDPIARHLTDYPNQEAAGTVTIHHLLTHTSGLGDYLDKQAFQQGPKDRFRSVASYFRLFANDPLLFQPGERFHYSNAGYIVLGRIIERVSGDNYFDYLHQHIYAPAGMTSSDSYELNQDIPNLAIGYLGITPAEEGARTNELALPFKGSPAGGSYSTVGDLLRFATALQTHTLLSPETTDMLLAGKIESGFDTQYGYGFIVERFDGVRIVGHSGGFHGVNARLDMYLDLGYIVVVLSNQDPAPVDTPVEKIRAMLTGK